LKRAESLAIDNIRRIAERLRAERNDAIALGQVIREDLEEALALLKEVVSKDVALSDAQLERLRRLVEKER
jgi:hypothetical protein